MTTASSTGFGSSASTSASASASTDRTLRVLSFNVWGLAIIAKERAARIRAIAKHLASSNYDIVCLQECWVYKDFELIRDEVVHTLPYARFFNSGALGSGLAIFTRFPLISARVMPYDLSGTPQQAIAGDFFVNKAAANVGVFHPILGELEIWTTHMHAGGDQAPDTRQAHRIGEAWQLSNAVRDGAARGRYVMAMGDFNAQPDSIPISLLRSHAQMTDSFLQTHPRANELDNLPLSPEVAMSECGMSCDSPLNTWSAAKNISEKIRAQGGKRLDYIFYRQPDGRGGVTSRSGDRERGDSEEEGRGPELHCVKCELVLTDLVPGKAFSYSDHAGLYATFEIGKPRPTSNPFSSSAWTSTAASDKDDPPYTFTPALAHLPGSPSTPERQQQSPSSLSTPDLIRRASGIISDYAILSQRAARLHLRMSAVCIVALVALSVGSAWQPKSYIQPIFTVLGGLLGAAGATSFYLGFAWGRWEAGILSEVVQEMELELDVIGQGRRIEG
ncbi:inositol phosphorylsphingolipid-phospholipase C [Dioszegia hungarica]|uniref:Inositol phosphorylsphingolipid-phospholipase C n=1 Tax=Dioszegia hungarica TaxID=4972 RepID=A0AA38H4L8_9TREE|nr:inositol phosphorylsphingolipid-phospholipase C [Dioszegia hungarica]KAI9632529.1 inositol phosphorylsphingolipid-phospholipase C [Dioszegia hungarica]